jgi:endonuclease-3
MKKQERADHINERLDELFPEVPVPLDHKDPYTLLVAVLLSAQCTDVRVNQVTPKLWELADNPYDMVKKTIQQIEDIVRPCGLAPRKAKAIWHLSEILINEHDGVVPNDLVALEKLPGVGHKTASVTVSQAFGVPAFPVDTHIHRLCQIWGLTNGKNVVQTEADCRDLFPEDRWNDLHLQIIFYGREHCQARGCDGLRCMLCQEMYPKRKSPITYKKP